MKIHILLSIPESLFVGTMSMKAMLAYIIDWKKLCPPTFVTRELQARVNLLFVNLFW